METDDALDGAVGDQPPVDAGRPGREHALTPSLQRLPDGVGGRSFLGIADGGEADDERDRPTGERHVAFGFERAAVDAGTATALGDVRRLRERFVDGGRDGVALVDGRDGGGEHREAAGEVVGAVEWVDDPDVGRIALPAGLLAVGRVVRELVGDDVERQSLGLAVGLRLHVVFQVVAGDGTGPERRFEIRPAGLRRLDGDGREFRRRDVHTQCGRRRDKSLTESSQGGDIAGQGAAGRTLFAAARQVRTMTELPLDAYYDLTRVGSVAVSPDGERVAFTTTEYDPDEDDALSSVFVAPADGSRDPHRLTRVSGAGSPKWSPDGDRLAFIASRDEDTDLRVGRDGDEDDEDDDADNGDEPESQVWCFDLALGGDARQLTAFEEGVREFDWGPDGDRIVVSARDPTDAESAYLEERRDGGPIETERTQHKLDGVGWTDTVTTYLFVVGEDAVRGPEAADAERARKLADAYGQGAVEGSSGLEPAWGAGGEIAFVTCRADNPDDTNETDILTISPEGGDAEPVTNGGRSCSQPRWSPSGEHLAFAVGDAENWCIPTAVHVWDGESTGSLTAGLDRTLAWGATFEWVDDETLYTTIADEAKSRLLRCTVGEEYERTFEAQGDDRAVGSFAIGGDTVALVLSHPNEGQNVYGLDIADVDGDAGSLTRLSEVNDSLREAYEMPEVTRVEYENDGWPISGVVYHPPDFDPADPDPRPLVCAIHGGPISYDEPEFRFDHAVLTSRGYVVFRPNYRGGSSFGRDFCETLYGQWGTVEASDIVAGVEALVDRGWADADRVFGYGFSYGGIAQGYLVTQYPDLFTAAAPEHGIYDLRSAYGTDDSHVWMENEYGFPWENKEAVDAGSAINDVGNIETPLLVTAGGEDWRCPPSQSEQFYMAAQRVGAECRLVIYEDEHHNIGMPDRAIHRLEEITAWYRRHDPAVDDDGAVDPHGRAVDEEDEQRDDQSDET